MNAHPRRAALAGAVALVALCSTVTLAQPGGGDDEPVVLRLAVADDALRPSGPYVAAFVEEVAARSGGSVTIEPVWSAGESTPQGFEQGVANLLVDGKADLALSAARGWHDAGITSLLALQAPFLIANDALAVAVATSPVADALLAAMTDHGIEGLAMWPEDLRHPVAFEPCLEPIGHPEQLQGSTIRAIPSEITLDIIEALGATHTAADSYESLVASCEIQAAESGLLQGQSLPGRPTFTVDVTFFPKYQVLAANGESFSGLSPARQAILREAAIAVRDKALAEHPSDADAAAAWCASGGRVVHAGPDGVAAFKAAARSVHEQLAQDPVVGSAIAEIQQLATATPVSPTVECKPPTRASGPEDPTDGVASELPAIGSWRIEQSADRLVELGATEQIANVLAGVVTLSFDGQRWSMEHIWGPRRAVTMCGGTYELASDALVLVFDQNPTECGSGRVDLIWTADGLDRAEVRNAEGGADEILLVGAWTRLRDAPA